jgi:hypothetical protein
MRGNIRVGDFQRRAAPFGSKPTPDALDETPCVVVGDWVTLLAIGDRASLGRCDPAGDSL